MLVLSYPKKNILLSLAVIVTACLFAPVAAKAQAQAATINPDGGNTPTDGLRITITDTAILVRKNGIDQYNLSDTIPRQDRGLKTYVILQQKWGTNTIKQPTYLQACDISGVHGDGTIASPWKVATHTTLNNPTGGIYNLTTIYSYVNGNDYYLVDFYISAHERYLSALDEGGPYYMHIYFSERSWMNNSDTAKALEDDWISCTTDMYYDDEVDFGMTPAWNLPQLVGAECGSGDCPGGFIGGHYFKTKGGFTSYKVGAPQGRDTKPDPGYELESQITSIIQSMGVAVHKTLEVDAVNLGKTRNLTKRFIIGFDRAEIAALDLPEPSLILSDNYGQTSAPDSSKVTIELSSAVSSGMEGEVTHPLEGLTLSVSGGMFNAPQIAYLRVVITGTGTGHAAPGTDYQELYTHVIIPAESYFTPVQIPLNNILIKGDAIENPDKTLTVELLPTCAPYLKLGSVQSSAYTIVDDDEHKIFVEAAQPTLDEGKTMKVKVRMTGELLPTPVTVTLSKGGTSEAENEDHSPVPPTVTIPAGALEVEFDLEAVGDRILEPDETLEINATAVFGAETKTAADTIQIIDTTRNNAANKVIHFITQNAPETTPVTFTASLPAGVSTELPVDITMPLALSSGSVASSGDFNTIFPATITIGAFGSSVDFTMTAKADSRIEPDEIAYFDATATGFTVQQGSFYVIDNQANKQITITFDASEVSENGMVTGTVTLPYLTSYALELDLLRDPSSVAEDDDFSFQDTKVTFVPNTIDATFVIDINSDLWLELDELLAIGGTYKDFTIVPGTVTIKDETRNEPGMCDFTIEPQGVDVLEGNSINIKVKLAPGVQSTEPITIDLSASGLDAADYTIPLSVTIDPGENEATFVLAAEPDMIIEPAEQLQITGTADIAGYSAVYAAVIDILDATGNDPDNRKITVNTPLSVTEGGNLSVTFSLPPGITTFDVINIDVAITQTGAGYADNADFAGGVPFVLTIPAGGNQVIWTVSPVLDGVTEGTEHLVLQATNSTGFTVNDNNPVDVEVLDNTAPNPNTNIVFTAAQTTMVEGGALVEVTAALQAGTAPSPIVITLDKLSGTTAVDADFFVTPANIVIPQGQSSFTFYISANIDSYLENREELHLGGIATGYTFQGTLLYIDDANSKQITLRLDDPSTAPLVEENSTLALRVKLDDGIIASENITVQLDRGAGSVASLLAAEYAFPATVVIPAGGNYISFDLEAKPDNVIEPVDERLEITATADIFGTTRTSAMDIDIVDATGSIPANKIITVTGAPTVTEGSTVTYTFSLPPGITSAQDIVINLLAGTASPATADADFDPVVPATVTIPAGADHVDLIIKAAADGIIEATEKLRRDPSSSAGYTFTGNISLDVTDNDMTGAAIVITSSANVTEGNAATITATLQGGLTAGTNIVVTLSKGIASTADVADHGALANITIPPGSSSGTTSLTTALDDLLESPETVIIEGAAPGFTVTGTTITIDDRNGEDAANKIFTVTPDAASVAEGSGIKVWVRLPSPQRTQEALTITLQRGSATSATLLTGEYNFPATVIIPAGGSEVSFDLDVLTDNVIEPVEELEIEASAMVYGTSITASEEVNITDANNKAISITGPTSVTEGSTATITFSLPSGITTAEAITIGLAPGTATPATTVADFNPALPATVTIPAGGDHVDLQVSPITDGLLEPTEKLRLIPSASGYTFGSDVTLDILDNDHTGATIALSASQSSIAEGGTSTTITATLLGGLTAGSNITIALNSATSSAALSTDHSALNTITISTGNTTGSTTITATSDNILERDETLILEGTATGFTVTGTTVTITDASGPKQITLTPEATTVTEGNTIKVWVRLPVGITTSENITVQLDGGAASVAGTSEYSFPATVIIPANGNEISFDVHANADNVIEPNELLEINAEADIFGTTVTANTSINIIDATGNKAISITGLTNVTEGSTATITFSLPTGITTAEAITIGLAPGTATPATIAADFSAALPVTVTIPAGGDHVDLQVSPVTDGLLEPTEKLHLIPSASGYTFGSDVTLDILDNDHTGATIALSASQSSIAEGGTSTTITATLLGGLTAGSNITIALSSATSSTALSTDHSALNTITINTGNTTGSTTITATSDNILERNETIILEGTATGFTVTGTTVTITDASGPKQITLTPEATTVTEGNTIKVWVRLPAGITTSENITVQLDRGAASVAGTSEYTFPATVIIPANGNEVSFNLGANTDNVIEPNELLEITAEADIFGTTVTTNTSINIIDATGNKTINITGPTSVTEGNTATITFSLPTGITTTEAITINLAPGTSAVDANDINGGIPAQAVIPAGSNAGTLQINATSDGIIEPTEKLHLIPSASGYTFGSDVALDIIDNDHSGATIALSTSQSSIAEGGTSTTITATLLGGLTAGSNITIALNSATSSTALSTDHSALNTITINTGNTTGSTTITATSDNILERNETLILEGTATGFPVTGTTVTITDASGPKQITLTPEATTVAEGNTIKVWVRLPVGITTSENITVQLDRGAASVAGPSEYTFPATVTIPANGNEVSFNLGANTDNVIEPNELLEITAEADIFGATTTANTSVNIIDATGNKTISITGPTNVTEGSTATITFSLPTGITTAQAITINLAPGTSTVDANDINGGIPVQTIIPAGSSAGTLQINVNTDNVIEPVEKLHLLPSAAGFTFSGDLSIDVLDANHSGTITITGPASVTEGNTATFTVSLPGALLAGSDIPVTLSRGTSSTSAGTDHSAIPATVTIKAGEHATSFTINASADNILEATESLIIEGTAAAYSVNGATLQIEDATSFDPANTVITLSPAASTIPEGNTAQFFVSLPLGIVSSLPIQVNLSKTAAASTAADTDHTQIPTDITIPAMSNRSTDFNISAVTDGIIEPQEMLKVDGTVPAGLSFAGAVIHIDDATGLNPANRQITVTIDSTILHEGSTSKVTFALPAGITTATAISITIAPHADYTLTPVVIAAGSNRTEVTLKAIQDNLQESTEIINLTGAATGFTFVPGTVTIPGDAAPALSVTALKTTDAGEPSTDGTFTLQLANSATAPADITVMYAIAGSATGGTDYTALSGQAIIRSGANSVTIPVTVQNDQLVEGTETIQLTLQSASYLFLGNPVACAVDNNSITMNIADNAGYDRSVRIEKIADAAEPNILGSLKVRFNSNITAIAPVTVTYTVTGTATAGTDYTALSGTVTIPAGQQHAVITVIPLDDQLKEGDETVIVKLTGTSFSIPGITWPLATQQEATVVLEDNDVVTMEVFAANEAAEGAVLPVTLRASQPSPVDIQVTVTLQHDAARTVSQTVPRSGTTLTVTLPANQTEVSFNMSLEDNETNDDDGFVNLLIEPQTSGAQPYGKGASGNTATRVTDNDPLEITFKKDTVRIMEGHTGTTPMPFTVVLSRRSTRAVTLSYEFGDAFEGAGADKDPQRANRGEDYHALITSIVIPPLQDEADIVVPVFGDVGAEEDEYFSLKLKGAMVASGQNIPVTGIRSVAIGGIMNDDMAIDMEIRVSKALSPNGDGRNDVLIIENIEKYPRNEIVILNRWGGTIFKTSNYNNQSNNFSGRSNAGGGAGNDLPDGSYFYVLHVWDGNGKMQRHTGYLVLKHAN